MQAQGVLFGQIAAVFGIVIAGVWSATQWTAAALGYQLRLGSPWFDFFGTPFARSTPEPFPFSSLLFSMLTLGLFLASPEGGDVRSAGRLRRYAVRPL